LRSRACEFNIEISLAFAPEALDSAGAAYLQPIGERGAEDCITDAKASTDAMIERGWEMYVRVSGGDCSAQMSRLTVYSYVSKPPLHLKVAVRASTEELARSACAYVAAMKEKEEQ